MDKKTPMKNKPLVNATCKLGNKGCFEDGRCHAIGNCENKIMTNADRIRAMSDEELADAIFRLHIDDCKEMHFCKESDRCDEILDKGELIPKEMCRACLMEWLKAAADGREEK